MSESIRLYLCDGGTITVPLRFFRAGEGAHGEMLPTPACWYVLTHPRGNVLIDGGNAAAVAADPAAHLGAVTDTTAVEMDAGQAVLPTLSRLGISPESVRFIVQTHLHFDHTGAIAEISSFPNAQVLVTRAEYEWAFGPYSLGEPLYCRADYLKPEADWLLLDQTDDGYDVFGDGVLRCWRTPGHTPGHQSLEVRLPSGTCYMLAADAAYTLDHLQERAIASMLVSASDAVASVRKLRRLAWRAQATIIAGHDPEQWPTLRRAPAYYD